MNIPDLTNIAKSVQEQGAVCDCDTHALDKEKSTGHQCACPVHQESWSVYTSQPYSSSKD